MYTVYCKPPYPIRFITLMERQKCIGMCKKHLHYFKEV